MCVHVSLPTRVLSPCLKVTCSCCEMNMRDDANRSHCPVFIETKRRDACLATLHNINGKGKVHRERGRSGFLLATIIFSISTQHMQKFYLFSLQSCSLQ